MRSHNNFEKKGFALVFGLGFLGWGEFPGLGWNWLRSMYGGGLWVGGS